MLTDDNTADEDLDKPNSLLISVSYTREKVAYRKKEGCSVVEMECSALAACAAFRNVIWGMILYTADSLADMDKYDERNWGGNAYEYALTLCLDAVIKL